MREKKKYTMLVVDDEAIISDGFKGIVEEEFSDIFRYTTAIILKKPWKYLSTECLML